MTDSRENAAVLKRKYNLKMVRTVDLNEKIGLTPVCFAPWGKYIFFSRPNSNELYKLTQDDFELVETLTPALINPMTIYADDGYVHVCDRGDGYLKIFDAETFTLHKKIFFENYPPGVISCKHKGILYGSSWAAGKMAGEVWKIENFKMTILFKRDDEFLPKNVFVTDSGLHISNFKKRTLLNVGLDTNRLEDERPLYDECMEETVFTSIGSGEFLGITRNGAIVKFTSDGKVVFYARNFLPANPFPFFGFHVLKCVEGRLYIQNNNTGKLLVVEV